MAEGPAGRGRWEWGFQGPEGTVSQTQGLWGLSGCYEWRVCSCQPHVEHTPARHPRVILFLENETPMGHASVWNLLAKYLLCAGPKCRLQCTYLRINTLEKSIHKNKSSPHHFYSMEKKDCHSKNPENYTRAQLSRACWDKVYVDKQSQPCSAGFL